MYYQTLNAALNAVDLVALWPLGTNINYGETVRVETEKMVISVYRSNTGRYELPVHYNRF